MAEEVSRFSTPSPDDTGERAQIAKAAYERASSRSCSRLRRQRDREARQLPFLHRGVEELQRQCERLKQELATTRQQKEAFQQEALTLRELIKLRDHPEAAAVAAASAATTTMLREEVSRLRHRVRELQQENVRCLLQSEEACEAAEFYRQHLQQAAEASSSLPQRTLATTPPLTGTGLPPHETSPSGVVAGAARLTSRASKGRGVKEAEPLERLCASLKDERPQSGTWKDKVASLQTDPSAALYEVTALRATSVEDVEVNHSGHSGYDSAGKTAQRVGVMMAPFSSTTSPHLPPTARADVQDMARLMRFTKILQGQNRMLTQRVTELAQRSVDHAKEMAALKMSCRQLQNGLLLQE